MENWTDLPSELKWKWVRNGARGFRPLSIFKWIPHTSESAPLAAHPSAHPPPAAPLARTERRRGFHFDQAESRLIPICIPARPPASGLGGSRAPVIAADGWMGIIPLAQSADLPEEASGQWTEVTNPSEQRPRGQECRPHMAGQLSITLAIQSIYCPKE